MRLITALPQSASLSEPLKVAVDPKKRMMEAPRNIRTVIISVVNMESVESGCQPVLIHPSIFIYAKPSVSGFLLLPGQKMGLL